MATGTLQSSANNLAPKESFHRLTVEQYDRMVEVGILTSNDRCELLEGWMIEKMTQYAPHTFAVERLAEILRELLPKGWKVRDQKPIRTPDSRPKPDLAIVPGPLERFANQHPGPEDIALVIEVADSTVAGDRADKGRIYARVGLPVYWVVNLVDVQVEVYTRPRAGKTPAYRQRDDFGLADQVPLILEGKEIGRIAVCELLPR